METPQGVILFGSRGNIEARRMLCRPRNSIVTRSRPATGEIKQLVTLSQAGEFCEEDFQGTAQKCVKEISNALYWHYSSNKVLRKALNASGKSYLGREIRAIVVSALVLGSSIAFIRLL